MAHQSRDQRQHKVPLRHQTYRAEFRLRQEYEQKPNIAKTYLISINLDADLSKGFGQIDHIVHTNPQLICTAFGNMQQEDPNKFYGNACQITQHSADNVYTGNFLSYPSDVHSRI